MRKRERSASVSPALRAVPPGHPPPPPPPLNDPIYHHRQQQQQEEAQQVLLDVLRRTSLAEQKDREIVEWLTDAASWLQSADVTLAGAGAMAELRHHVLAVLHTMPWWRIVEAVETRRGPTATTRAVTRWHSRLQLAFERVCVVLLEQSPHAVRGVLGVALRPFRQRLPVRDGARRLLPGDTVLRVMNTVAARYPAAVVLDALERCLPALVPRRRWAEPRHHTACIGLLLHLALEAHIPLFTTQEWGDDDGGNTAEQQREEQQQGPAEDSGTDGASVVARTAAAATATGMLSSSSSSSQRHHHLRPVEMRAPIMSASDVDYSDASINMASSSANTESFATRFTEFTMQNNKMLAYRNEIIRFVLQQLLDMELSLQNNDTSFLQDVMPSTASFSSCGTADCLRSLANISFGSVSKRPSDKPFIEILRSCTGLVFRRLADDLVRQQAAGVCGNAEWWREILAFHLTSVLRMECPICLLYLAPSLALLGNEEETVDMMHKLVSLVTKGFQPVQQNNWRGAAAATAAGPARVRMAPPTVGPLMIPMTHRVRAALYLYPLFRFMRDRLGNGEGTRKRLQKWVVQELKNTPSSSTPSLLVQVLFAQCAAISELLDADLVEEMEPHTSESRALRLLIDKYLIIPTTESKMTDKNNENVSFTTISNIDTSETDTVVAVPESNIRRLNLKKMETAGLLYPNLMEECPWDWRRYQTGRTVDH
ncbi:uncharacterized protein TM35_000231790 [Trypanosoma theileri]|uniref:Uncharacterized protein n=1 Tax=Trypanosoma theileri TaxID=67003 RepID=A0A1X0NRN5_9TRYP|nr:uncharacterized protein TM35_000231790 [Trypanosoma theileri]ORC87208.1 hypothetical protein TM35_000231790 [Trypanosoma theileri]